VFQNFSSWNLSLNPSKCVVFRFRKRFAGWVVLDMDTVYTLGGSRSEFV